MSNLCYKLKKKIEDTPASTLALNIFFLFNALGAGLSVPLYLLLPKGTVEFFGGIYSPSTVLWVRGTGAGDALLSYISFYGAFTDNILVKKYLIRALGLYNILHFGSFLISHYYIQPSLSDGLLLFVWSGFLDSFAAAVWFGFVSPVTSISKSGN
eukprot:TRINITY_DN1853_c0_g1_i2.p1 TRINITY_DN1853_c0_g1~~TRINITY_DN1853_c0_g1_i2.p1  ORF type:complete len:155 (-),score=19.49 TRINITY_DN1853_c0_g1_i2:41-505(-)